MHIVVWFILCLVYLLSFHSFVCDCNTLLFVFPPGVNESALDMKVTCLLLVVDIQEQLMELDCVLPLKALLSSSAPARAESAITLLSTLSAHPPNTVSLLTTCRYNDDEVVHHQLHIVYSR